MRHWVLCCLLLCAYLFSGAQLPLDQQRYADSLTTMLRHATNDSARAKVHFLLTYYWLSKDEAKAKEHLEKGKLASHEYPYLQAISFSHEGYFYYNTDLEKSEAAYRKSDSLLSSFTTRESYIIRSNIWNNMAVIQQHRNRDEAFTDMLLNKAIPLAIKAKDSALVASQYVALGVGLMNLEQYNKAERYFREAITILRNSNTQPSRLVAAYNRASENFIYLKKYSEAKALLDSIRSILAPYPESDLYSGYYLTEGMYHHSMGNEHAAINSYSRGMAAANGPNKIYRIQELQLLKAKSLIAIKDFEQAKLLFLQLNADNDAMQVDENRLGVYEGLAVSFAGTGNMAAAYQWQKQYAGLSDSINERRLKDEVNELEASYNNDQNTKKITLLQIEQEKASLSAKNQRLTNELLIASCIILLIIALFSVFYYRSNRKLSLQKEVNYQQRLRDMESQQQLSITHAMLEGEERERARVARDLHDGLGGWLASVKMDISKINNRQGLGENLHDDLQNVTQQLDGSVNELRRIARNMMPEALLKFGLVVALKDYCEGLDNTATNIVFQSSITSDISMDGNAQIMMYRIVQELVTNALKHANADSILVDYIQDDQQISITVEDSGEGFDIHAKNVTGMGLGNVQARVSFLKGKLDIQSSKGTGTTVNIQFDEFGKAGITDHS